MATTIDKSTENAASQYAVVDPATGETVARG